MSPTFEESRALAASPFYPCSACGDDIPKSKAQCPTCLCFNIGPRAGFTASPSGLTGGDEEDGDADDSEDGDPSGLETISLADVKPSSERRLLSGPWDDAWGGGIVSCSVTLLAGGPGAGKTTLILQALDAMLDRSRDRKPKTGYRKAFYCYVEGGAGSVADYAKRLGLRNIDRLIVPKAFPNADAVHEWISTQRASLPVLVDSWSALAKRLDPASQEDLAQAFKEYSVRVDAPSILLCHVNKGDDVAGFKSIEHWVDAVMLMTAHKNGKRTTPFRTLDVEKNRYGANVSTDLYMGATGLTTPPAGVPLPPSMKTKGDAKTEST